MTRARRARVNQNATRPFARRDASSVSLRTLAFTPDTDECSPGSAWPIVRGWTMTRASACLRVFTPPASSRARRARPPACSLPPTTTIPIRRSFPSTSPASSASARLHPPHPSVSILPATPTYPSHSRRVFLAPDAFDAFYLSSTRFTCSRRVSSATDASNPPSTRLSGPQRVFLILGASSLAYPGHDLSMACQRASRTGTTSPS